MSTVILVQSTVFSFWSRPLAFAKGMVVMYDVLTPLVELYIAIGVRQKFQRVKVPYGLMCLSGDVSANILIPPYGIK